MRRCGRKLSTAEVKIVRSLWKARGLRLWRLAGDLAAPGFGLDVVALPRLLLVPEAIHIGQHIDGGFVHSKRDHRAVGEQALGLAHQQFGLGELLLISKAY